MQGGGAPGALRRMDARPPFFTIGGGMLKRQCTQDFKILPLQRKVRELLGLKPRQRGPRQPVVEQWIGISADEKLRMKESRLPYIRNRWPLIERGMVRQQCIEWCEGRGHPRPPKSACTFCPYRDQDEWRALGPDDFADAVMVDEIIRPGMPGPKRPAGEQWFVHPSRIPLSEVDFTVPVSDQLDLFNNECEGMCGV